MKNTIFKTENFLIKALHKVERITNTIHTLIFEDDAKFPNPVAADLSADAVQDKIKALGIRLGDLNSECARSKKFDEATQQKIQDLQNTLKGLEETISKDHTEQDIQAVTSGLKDLRDFFNNKQQEVEAKLQDMQTQLHVIQEEIREDEKVDVIVASTLQVLQDNVANHKAEVANIKTEVTNIKSELVKILAALNILQAQQNTSAANDEVAPGATNAATATLDAISTESATLDAANSLDIVGADSITITG
jgi:chromosome segregation ATPase